jgi:hypothetical protein
MTISRFKQKQVKEMTQFKISLKLKGWNEINKENHKIHKPSSIVSVSVISSEAKIKNKKISN